MTQVKKRRKSVKKKENSNVSPNVAEILQRCRLFSNVPEASFQRLAVMARIRSYEKGRTIFREGDPCPGAFIVGEGLVRVYKIAPNGKEHVLHMVDPGETFAEVAAMGPFSCPANAQAAVPSICALLPLEPFRKALESDHDLCLGMMAGLTLWVRHLVGLMGDVVLRDAAGRVARYLLQQSPDREGLDQGNTVRWPALKRHVANHLNLTSETFSRTLRRLAQAGLIAESGNNRVELLDVEQLRQVSKGFFPEA